MIAAFNSVYTALQSFLSRSFWFANFLPVALFAFVHAIVAAIVVGPVNVWGVPLNFESSNLAKIGPGIVLAVVILAYLLAPLVPLLRNVLDGSQLPPLLHDWLRGARLADAYEKSRAIDERRDDASALRELKADAHDDGGRIRQAFQAGLALPGADDEASLRDARVALDRLNRALFSPGILADRTREAEAAMVAAFRRNRPEPRAGMPDDERRRAEEVNQAGDRYEDLLGKAAQEAEYRYEIVRVRNRALGALANPMATSIGDARLVAERYSSDVYGVDFSFLWPRLLAAIKAAKDDTMLSAIETARSTVDFAVMCVLLTATLPLVWFPAILYLGQPAWMFLAIGAATPIAFRFFLALAFEGQLAFGDVIKTAIDQHRFLVLKTLRQPEPQSRNEERRLWLRIKCAEEDARTADLVYIQPKPGAGG